MSDRSITPQGSAYVDDPIKGYPDATNEPLPDAAPTNDNRQKAPQIEIRVVDQQGNECHFKIRTTTKFDKVFTAFTERQNVTQGSLRFLFDGQRVGGDDTPESLEMENGDTIEAHTEMVGGGLASTS
ncbi:hypothetical protein N0V82_003238 [Gnomoniopsis sp. IMI 355080]|nr:hypothetical protein N0V82_003238 [Gnomoniopsis sp. IMI 355080]